MFLFWIRSSAVTPKNRKSKSESKTETKGVQTKGVQLSRTKGVQLSRTEKANVEYFKRLLDEKGVSQHEAARHLKISQAVLSRIFHGKRKLHLDEANKLSAFLGVPFAEVLSQSGIETHEPQAPVIGFIDSELNCHPFSNGRQTPQMASNPTHDDRMRVYRFETGGSRYSSFDGALVYFIPKEGVDAEAVGKLMIVKIAGDRQVRLRELRRGYNQGRLKTYNLASLSGEVVEENAEVISASPVVWFKV